MASLEKEMLFTGLQVAYYIVCPTKLWLFSHFLPQEKNSELVELGKLLQQEYFLQVQKNLIVDQKIAIDFIKKEGELILHEIKKSSKLENAHVVQLLYYLYYLRYKKGVQVTKGVINYPKERKIIEIELTKERKEEIENILSKIKEITSQPKPPQPTYKKYCRKCAYFEFCFGD
jgi:CRISPR-associated exonuclease Cas4